MQFLLLFSYGLNFLVVYNTFALYCGYDVEIWHYQIAFVLYVQKLNENSHFSSSLLVFHVGKLSEHVVYGAKRCGSAGSHIAKY